MSGGAEKKGLLEADGGGSYGAAASKAKAAAGKGTALARSVTGSIDDGAAAAHRNADKAFGKSKAVKGAAEHYLVANYQMDTMENPEGALFCARLVRASIFTFACIAVIGLVIGFIMKHGLPGGGVVEMEQVDTLPAPSIMLCASPWGSSFKSFKVDSVDMGRIPGNSFSTVKFDVKQEGDTAGAPAELDKCHNILLNTEMHQHGQVGQYTSFDTIRMRFSATTEDGNYNFGFMNADGPIPQLWSYASLNSRTTGHVTYDQMNVGKNELVSGTPRSNIAFEATGSTNSQSGTELEYFYRYFMKRSLSAQSHGISLLAIVSFLLLLAAAVGNCGIFDLIYVEYTPDGEQPALEPNRALRETCGSCFASCRRRKDLESDDEGAIAEAIGEDIEGAARQG